MWCMKNPLHPTNTSCCNLYKKKKIHNSYTTTEPDIVYLVLIFNNYQVFWDIIDLNEINRWNKLIDYISLKYNFDNYDFNYTVNNNLLYYNQNIGLKYLILREGCLQIKIDEKE